MGASAPAAGSGLPAPPDRTVVTPTPVVRGAGPGICFIAQLPGGPWGRRIKGCLGAPRSAKGRPGLIQSPQMRERASPAGPGVCRSRRGPVRRGHAPWHPSVPRPRGASGSHLGPGSAPAGCENARALRGWPPLPAAAPLPGDSAPSTQEPVSKATSSTKPSGRQHTTPNRRGLLPPSGPQLGLRPLSSPGGQEEAGWMCLLTLPVPWA